MAKPACIEIDDTDTERTRIWVNVIDADGEVIELIEQYTVEDRDSACAMALLWADALHLPLKLRIDRDREPLN